MEKRNVKEMSIEELSKAKIELRDRLKEVATELICREIKNEVQSFINQNPDVKEIQDIKYIKWDFEPEYDDEGGYDYWPTGVTAYDKDNHEIDEDQEVEIEVKSSWSDTVYTYSLHEIVREIISDRSGELYDNDIYEIEI